MSIGNASKLITELARLVCRYNDTLGGRDRVYTAVQCGEYHHHDWAVLECTDSGGGNICENCTKETAELIAAILTFLEDMGYHNG